MAWIPAAERLVVYSKLQNALYIVDSVTGDGQLLNLDLPLLADMDVPKERAAFMRARVKVAMVQSYTNKGGILLHVVGGSDLFAVYYENGQWQAKRLALLGVVSIQRVQVIFDTKLLIEDANGENYSCILQHATSPSEGFFFSALTEVTLCSLEKISHGTQQGTEGASLLSPGIQTPPLITAAFSDGASSNTGWTAAAMGDDTSMGGFTAGFDNQSVGGIIPAGAEGATYLFRKPDEMIVAPERPADLKILNMWMEQLQAVITVVCQPNSVSIHTLDYTRGTFFAAELGPTVGASPAATPDGTLTQDGLQKWQKWCKVVCMTELSDGRLALLQEDGMVRIFEFAAEALAMAEAEWKIMIGASDGAQSLRLRRGDGTQDETYEGDEDWEEGVVLRVHEGSIFDVQLISGEVVEALEASALDSDDSGPIAAGSTVWVDMMQVEWEDDGAAAESKNYEDESENQKEQKGRGNGNGTGKGNGSGRGQGRGKGRSGTGGRTGGEGLLDLNFNFNPGAFTL
jgi:hypothetical protein